MKEKVVNITRYPLVDGWTAPLFNGREEDQVTEIKEVEGGIVVELKDDAIEYPPEQSKEWLESREGLREQEVDESLESEDER